MTRTASLILLGLAAVALLFLLALLAGSWSFIRRARAEAETLFAQAPVREGTVVSQAMLAGLPAPVRRYLTYTGVVGKPIPRTIRLRQVGRIRQDAGQPWRGLVAEEYFTVEPPAFVWIGTMQMAGLPAARARDRYTQGAGGMLIKLASLVTITDAAGPEIGQGAQMRYLQEAAFWFPAALLSKYFSFQPIDDRSARVTLTDRGRSVSGVLSVDREGRLVDFVAPRCRTVDGRFELETWSTPVAGYGEFEGLRLPVKGTGVWKLSDGDLEYIEVVVTELEYDAGGP